MSAEVFISYKSEEESYARRIRTVLEQNGISCWMAPDSIPAGSNYMKQIPMAIDGCKVMIVLISEKSQHSTWVRNEFSQAVSKEKRIIPYLIQNCELEDEFEFSLSTMQQIYAWRDEEAALTKVVKDIKEAIGSDPNTEIRVSVIKKDEKKRDPKLCALIGILAVVLLGGILFFAGKNRGSGITGNAPVSVYYSEVLPFQLTGSLATAREVRERNTSAPFYNRAVSLLSFIRSKEERSQFIEKIECAFDSVEPVQTPVYMLDGVLIDDTVSVFLYNDGWGDGEDVTVEWDLREADGVPVFPELMDALTGSASVSCSAGSAVRIFQTTPGFHNLLEWARARDNGYMQTLYTLYVHTADENSGCAMFLVYEPDTDSIGFDYGGAGDEFPGITMYGILDVDDPPESLRFAANDTVPMVEDSYRIETVIIPTKSCRISVFGRYMIDGTEYTTDRYEAEIRVPVFNSESIIAGGALTQTLAGMDMSRTADTERVLNQHRYDIESILAPNGIMG